MRRSIAFCSALVLGLFILSGCGSSSSKSGGAPGGGGGGINTTPTSLSIHDTPPAGVTILSFEVTITGAVLQPGNVALVSTPQKVEITRLQTESAFLNTVDVPTGTYNSLALTFANPELSVQNNSGAAIGKCGIGAICQFEPSISPVTVTLSSAPFPRTMMQGTPAGLTVDVSLNKAIQSDLSINLAAAGAVSVAMLPGSSMSGEMEHFDDVTGTVQSIGTNQFTLQTSDGHTLAVGVDSNTEFDFEEASCVANNFSCLAMGQVLEVSLSMQGSGNFVASEVNFEDGVSMEEVEGIVVSIGAGAPPTSFQIVVHDEIPAVANVARGNLITVNIQSGATFLIDNSNFTLPGGVSFQSASDLAVGQEVQVRVAGTPAAGPPISFATNRIDLHASQITATVGTVNSGASSFTLTGLPGLFTTAAPTAIAQIQVQTTSQTQFESLNPSGIAGLSNGMPVSVEGFLFNTIGSPTLAAEKVEGRSSGL